ncbi:hypothetical protein ES703_115976 [subsurface metagenome]
MSWDRQGFQVHLVTSLHHLLDWPLFDGLRGNWIPKLGQVSLIHFFDLALKAQGNGLSARKQITHHGVLGSHNPSKTDHRITASDPQFLYKRRHLIM